MEFPLKDRWTLDSVTSHSRRRKHNPLIVHRIGESPRYRHKPVHAVIDGRTIGTGRDTSRPTGYDDAFGQYGLRKMIGMSFQSPIQDPDRIGPSTGHRAAFSRFQHLIRQLARPEAQRRFVFADIHDLLAKLSPHEFSGAVKRGPDVALSPFTANYLCGMVEYAAGLKGARPPSWTADVAPLRSPWFGTDLKSLRLHLLTNSPAPFRRRNIFIDSSIGTRV